jgi:hypothetical protein
MTPLYDSLQPLVLAINQEGGNMSSFHLSKPVLDAIDQGVPIDPSLVEIRDKILEKIGAYQGKRDHLGFNQIFEAYSEGVIYLAATRRRGLALKALAGGAKHGKTPDFVTAGDPPVGLEVKTINVFDPARTIDAAMNNGFETAYAATEKSRAEAAKTGRGGVGFAENSFAPHGEGVDPKGAVEQTIRKIENNFKSGQYQARPTLLVVSLVRLGVHQRAVDLRRRLDIDTDCDVAPSGQLFAIAARNLDDAYFDYSHQYFGARDAGPLKELGTLREHPEIAGMVFLETIWNKSGDPDAIETGFKFNGIWNSDWRWQDRFTAEQHAAAKLVFDHLCDAWNDTDDSRAPLLPDLRALHSAFMHEVGAFATAWRGKTPDAAALATFMIKADCAYFMWRAAEVGLVERSASYTSPAVEDVHTGHIQLDQAPAIFLSTPRALPEVPRLQLVRRGGGWSPDDSVGAIQSGIITL